jgi:low affinity Fe/Cu permease
MMRDAFARFAHWTADAIGSPLAFVLSLAVVVVWAAFGPVFHWSDTHQLVINTSTTIVTFWVVFLLQASANRQDRATQTKLDELLRANADARNEVMRLEEREEADAERIRRAVEQEGDGG